MPKFSNNIEIPRKIEFRARSKCSTQGIQVNESNTLQINKKHKILSGISTIRALKYRSSVDFFKRFVPFLMLSNIENK